MQPRLGMFREISRRNVFRLAGGSAIGAWLASGPIADVVAGAGKSRPPDEDGYDLWLRYRLVDQPGRLREYRDAVTEIVGSTRTPVLGSALAELQRGLSGLLGRAISVRAQATKPGAILVGTKVSSPAVATLIPERELAELGPEGYVLRTTEYQGMACIVIAGGGDPGVLYGAFHLLRLMQTQQRLHRLNVRERPVGQLRLVDHWDNLNRTVERGYAGKSIFDWNQLPALEPRYTDYARVLASVGVNGTVVNNVNANPAFLASDFLPGLAALAAVLRGYGIRLYLSANFACPIALGGLSTADPLDPAVAAWWRAKVNEIYGLVPDFGGFLVKANSEGQPGPQNYGRTHADGANMIADALRPHGGIVMWRAFVHGGPSTWARDSYDQFHPLDGEFAENAIVQIKNGPIDFNPREPVHPLFGGLPHTNSMIELQITQEYTGHTTDLCYLPAEWQTVLDFDTHAAGAGTLVRDIVAGRVYQYSHCGFAGVINFGDDRNWTGTHLAAANTHGYARLAWNPALRAEDLAEEWVRMTFGNDPQIVHTVTAALSGSWRDYLDYTEVLGQGYLVTPQGEHFLPDLYSTVGFTHADASGVGFDRTVATGTGYTDFYHSPVSDRYEDLSTCPEQLLLFFHHVPYSHRLTSGRPVIEQVYESHFTGRQEAIQLRASWRGLRRWIDAERFGDEADRFDAQVEHATLWRDTVVGYFFEISRILDSSRSWVQARFGGEPLVFGGVPNQLTISVGNASPNTSDMTVRLVGPDGWSSGVVAATAPAREFVDVHVPVTPPVAPAIAAAHPAVEAGGLPVLLPLGPNATGRTVATTPAPPLCVFALDAGTSYSPVLFGYTSLSPLDTWDADRGFGWVGGTPQDRDRGAPDALRRDFVTDTVPRTLRLAVPPGSHSAYLLVGDAGPASYPTIVRSGGQVLAQTKAELPGGQFEWIGFSLDGGTSGRTVDLTLEGIPGEYWHLVSLVLLKSDTTPPDVVVTDVRMTQPLLGGRSNPVVVTVANTTSVDITATVRMDAPSGWTSASVECVLKAASSTEVTVPVTPPLQPSVATTVSIVIAARGGVQVTQPLTVPTAPSGGEVALALDAGSTSSPVLDSYRRLSPVASWDPDKGFGWVGPAPGDRDRGRLDDLRRDFVLGRDRAYTLRIAVPAGVHRVWVLTGDADAESGETIISIGGTVVATSGDSTIPFGQFRWFDFSVAGGVGGRIVDLDITGALRDRYWRIAGLVLTN